MRLKTASDYEDKMLTVDRLSICIVSFRYVERCEVFFNQPCTVYG